ncbi:MAG: hypothetical protein ABI321_24360 [Polyangia bacterium]
MDPRIEPYVEAARGYVRRALSLELDTSPESLAYIDHYVRSTRGTTFEPDVLRLTAAALGAYFGEVLIASFGGGWALEGGEASPERWRVELDPPTLTLSPVSMAAYALAGAKAAELGAFDDHVTPPMRDAAALAQLLESSAPVDADYFYSLTGRFEGVEQMRELLAEIDRRRQAGPPPDEVDPDADADPDANDDDEPSTPPN